MTKHIDDDNNAIISQLFRMVENLIDKLSAQYDTIGVEIVSVREHVARLWEKIHILERDQKRIQRNDDLQEMELDRIREDMKRWHDR
jgi:hypothetical protein